METLGILYSGSPRNGRQAIEETDQWMKTHCKHPLRIVAPVWTDNLLERAVSVMTADVVLVRSGSRAAHAAMKSRGAAKKPILVFTTVAPYIRDMIDPKTMTGVCAHTSDHDAARLDKLLDMLGYTFPTIGVLRNSNRGDGRDQWTAIADAASGNCRLVDADINGPLTIKKAFAQVFPEGEVDAVLVAADPFFYNNLKEVVDRGTGYRAIYQWSEYVSAGGFMSYGPNLKACYERAYQMCCTIGGGGAVPPVYDVPDTEFELFVNRARATQLNRWPLPAAIEKYGPTVV